MKKIVTGLSICLGLLIFAGCSNHKTHAASEKTSESTQVSISEESEHKDTDNSTTNIDLSMNSSSKDSSNEIDSSQESGGQEIENSSTTEAIQAITNNTENTALNATNPTSSQSSQTANTWSSMDEAIQFFETTYKNPENKLCQSINWSNYDRSYWSLVENSGENITLHLRNAGGSGGSYYKFMKDGDYTNINEYSGNASYPDTPTAIYTIKNDEYKQN